MAGEERGNAESTPAPPKKAASHRHDTVVVRLGLGFSGFADLVGKHLGSGFVSDPYSSATGKVSTDLAVKMRGQV